MRTLTNVVIVSALFAFSATTAFSQEGGAKKNPSKQMVTQFIKQFEKAELTDEQSIKVKEMISKVAEDITTKRTEVGITAEIMKKRNDVSKQAREEGKKPKEVRAVVEAALALTPEQMKVLSETEKQLTDARIAAGKLLTPEQIAKLPEPVQKSLNATPKKEKAGA